MSIKTPEKQHKTHKDIEPCLILVIPNNEQTNQKQQNTTQNKQNKANQHAPPKLQNNKKEKSANKNKDKQSHTPNKTTQFTSTKNKNT